MLVVALHIENFRGIASLEWVTDEQIICLVGPGDAGKTTVLDAIEWALSPRWGLPVSDADFHNLKVETPITIRVTVAEVPEELLADQTYLHSARYRCAEGIHDEPLHEDDTQVLTVQLTVDDTLEPQWHVVGGEGVAARRISSGHRAALGVTRLGGDPDRHLRWGRGSSLDRLTEETGGATLALAAVYRTARKGVTPEDLSSLDDAVQVARAAAPAFGAGVQPDDLAAAIDPGAFTPSAGALSLHVANVPLTAAGLGTRRLAALALQAASVPAGAIVLVDEIEAGLEPHRLRHLLRLLRARVHGEPGHEGPKPAQVLMTTHSPIAVVELRAEELAVTRRNAGSNVELKQPDNDLQGVIRGYPEALLAKSVIIGEGLTEHGLVRGLEVAWASGEEAPLSHRGVAVVAGGGCTKAPGVAIHLTTLGYRTAILVDSDQPIVPNVATTEAAGVHVAQWDGTMCTEQRISQDVNLSTLAELLALLAEERGAGQVRGDIAAKLGRDAADLPIELDDWTAEVGEDRFRLAVGDAMANGGWMKQIGVAEQVGLLIGPGLPQLAGTNLADTLSDLRQWSHGA